MIKRLQKKYIAIAMLAVVVLLTLIIGSINIHNYIEINQKASDTLYFIALNNGRFPQKDNVPPSKSDGPNHFDEIFSPEAPFETRYFTVTLNSDEKIIQINCDKIAAITEEEAEAFVSSLINKNKKTGFIENYKYLKALNDDGLTMYIFLDCTKELSTFRQFLISSIIMSLIGTFCFLILVIIFTKIVTSPVIKTLAKQQQFITDASHELKTPLTIINASCDVLGYQYQDNEWITSIKAQVSRLTDLTNKLVFLSKMDEETKKFIKTDFSLNEVLKEVLEPFISLSKATKKEFTYNIQDNLSINGDVSLIKEMFNLLLDNAFKYSTDKGLIKLDVFKSHKKIKIVLSNETASVPVGDLSILFDRFYRLDSSRNSELGGHGIGLSVVKAIVEEHKGTISAKSTDGVIITFTILI